MDQVVLDVVAKICQGPVLIELGYETPETALKILSEGDVSVETSEDVAATMLDVIGKVDEFVTDENAQVTLTIPEITYDMVKRMYSAGLDGTTYMGVGHSAGTQKTSVCTTMRIRPWALRNEVSPTRCIEFWKVAVSGNKSIRMGKEAPHGFVSVVFQVFKDTSQTDGMMLFKITSPTRS